MIHEQDTRQRIIAGDLVYSRSHDAVGVDIPATAEAMPAYSEGVLMGGENRQQSRRDSTTGPGIHRYRYTPGIEPIIFGLQLDRSVYLLSRQGIIREAHYGKNEGDHLPFARIRDFAAAQ